MLRARSDFDFCVLRLINESLKKAMLRSAMPLPLSSEAGLTQRRTMDWPERADRENTA